MKRFFSSIILTVAMVLTISSCKLALDAIQGKIDKDNGKDKTEVYLSSLYWAQQKLNVKVGDLVPLQLNAEPKEKRNKAKITYAYNNELIKVIADSRGVMVEGVKQGKTILSAENGNIVTNCSVTVEGYAEDYEREPYIYTTSSNNIIQLKPGTSERVVVSLYGGKVEDNQAFTWTVEKPNIAEVLGNGQFCVINGKAEGNTKITVRHPKAAYDFTFLVYVLQDAQNVSYITTKTNVLTMKLGEGEKEISVAMQNAPAGFNTALYEWTLETDPENPMCSIDANSEKAVVMPIRAGTAKLKITHPSASYPLEILVRVVEIVENVYIKASETNVVLEGNTSQTVTFELVDYKGVYDKNAFVFEIPEQEVFDFLQFGNTISLTGKKNGTEKIIVTHPAAKYPLEIIVTATKQAFDAVDVSKYITTSKNYIRTKVGAEPTTLDIIFSGGKVGDNKDFKWSIAHSPKEEGKKVIDFKTTDGEVTDKLARAITSTVETGKGIITPVAEGTATITITNRKALYPTEVIVEVLPEYVVLDSEYWFVGDNIVSLLNGSEKDISVSLNGADVSPNDYTKVTWETESKTINLIPNELTAKIQATGTEKAISALYVKHPRVPNFKKITVLQANTQEELDAMKALATDNDRLIMHVNETASLSLTQVGFTQEEIDNIGWEIINSEIASINNERIDPETSTAIKNNLYPEVTGIKAGSTKIICHSNIAGVPDVTFDIIVVPEGVDISYAADVVYLTTMDNVVVLTDVGDSTSISVDMKGAISNYEKQNIQWENKNEDIVSIVPNGTGCTIKALKQGEAVLHLTHVKSKNSLNIFVYVGNKMQYKKDKTVFITADKSVIAVVKGTKPVPLTVKLENSATQSGFHFDIDNSTIAKLDYSSSNTYYVTPREAGEACITISHDESKFDKKVLVVVANTEEELKGFKYLSTANNVVTVVEGSQVNVSVAVMNSSEIVLDGFHWESGDRAVVDIVSEAGAVATITGNSAGTTKLTVTNDACAYPLEIIVKCVSAAYASSQPYIATPATVVVLKAGERVDWKQITATLEGGNELDQQNFAWTVDDSSIVTAFGQGNRCNLKAIKAGATRLQITHPKAEYPCYVLLICENIQDTKYMIALKNVSNIITMKPTDKEMSVIVNLVNGDVDDKYGFQWSLDNWDVIEMTANGNTATIKPLMEGQATIRISHPKANNDEAIVVKVQEYANFGFGVDYVRTSEGKDYMLPLQVPVSNIKTRIECETMNSNVCTITNVNKIAQITGIKAGTTTVKAKLVAAVTNQVISEAEMMVVVDKAAAELTYITTTKTTYVLEKGMIQDLIVDLQGEGIVVTDKYNLQWKSSDEKVVKILGASTTGIATGDMVKIQAIAAGDAIITVMHEKCATQLTIRVNVPTSGDVDISLNKTAMRIERSGSNTQASLKASLINAEYSDYKTIEWSSDKVNGVDILKILGSGEEVLLLPIANGHTIVHAKLPNGKQANCDVEIVSARVFEFLSRSVDMVPGEQRKVQYNFVPKDGRISFSTDGDDKFDYVVDQDAQEITITGKKVGTGKIYVSSESGAAALPIRISWNYSFNLDKHIINEDPSDYNPDDFVINYSVTPANAEITATPIDSVEEIIEVVKVDTVHKKIILKPLHREGTCKLQVRAINKEDGNRDFAALSGNNIVNIQLRTKEITFTPQILSQDGNYSRVDSADNSLVISDGEKVNFKFNSNVELANIKVAFEKADSKEQSLIKTATDGNGSVNSITHTKDYFENFYVLKNKYHTYYRDKQNRFGMGKGKTFEVTRLEKINHADGAYYNIYMDCTDVQGKSVQIIPDKDHPFGAHPYTGPWKISEAEERRLKAEAFNNAGGTPITDGEGYVLDYANVHDGVASKMYGARATLAEQIEDTYAVADLWCEKGETLPQPIYFTMNALKNSVFYTCEIKQIDSSIPIGRVFQYTSKCEKFKAYHKGLDQMVYKIRRENPPHETTYNIYPIPHAGHEETFLIPKTDFEEIRFDGMPTKKELIGYMKISYERNGKTQQPIKLPVYTEMRYNCTKDTNYSWTETVNMNIIERDRLQF